MLPGRCSIFPSQANFNKGLPIFVGALYLLISFLIVGCGDSDIQSKRYEYDDQGRLVKMVSPKGDKTSYEYDEKGQISKISDSDNKVQLGYDARGNVALIEDDAGRTERSYDNLNRLIEVRIEGEPNKTINYDYDSQGFIARKRISSDETLEYQIDYKYDLLGNLLSVDDGSGVVRYEYDFVDRNKVRILPNGVKSIFSYGPNNEVLTINHLGANNEAIAKYTYLYDVDGNLTEKSEEDYQGTYKTRYEWKNQKLIGLVTSDNTSLIFEYDAGGNRIALKQNTDISSYQFDNSGRITNIGGITFDYDDNGNMVKRTQSDNYHEIEYYSDNKPSIIKTSGQEIEFKYNGLGNLIYTKKGDEEIKYLPDALSLDGLALNKYSENENIFYTYGDSLLASRNNDQSTYYLEDGLGSNRLSLDGSGNIVDRNDNSRLSLEYNSEDPFGDWRMDAPTVANFSIDPTPLEIRDLGTYSHELISASIISSNSEKVLHAFEPTLEDRGYEKTSLILVSSFDNHSRSYDFEYPVEWYMKKTSSHFLGKVITATWGKTTNTTISYFMGFVDPATKQYFRAMNGGPIWAMEDSPRYGMAGLEFIGGTLFGVPGVFVANGLGVSAQEFGKFLGTRLDRPYSWLDWKKWMAEKDYQAFLMNANSVSNPKSPISSDLTDLSISLTTPINTVDQDKCPPNCPPPKPPCPPFCPPDDHGGGGATVLHSSPSKFLDDFDKEIGGIRLDPSAKPSGDFYIGDITGAVWDDEKQELVLLGGQTNSLSGINPEDLAVAMKAVYAGRDPQFSLDPADPENPNGPELKAVYYGPIEDTSFGQAMFDADWLMKEYSFGVKQTSDGKEQEIVSKVPGYKDIFDLSFAQETLEESYMRFWITCEDVPIYQKDNGITFGPIKMKINTEKMFVEENGLASSGGEQDESAEAFAANLTEHYEEFALTEPAFHKMEELAKAVAIAQWLKEKKVPLDGTWIDEYIAKGQTNTPESVSALSRSEERSETSQDGNRIITKTRTVSLFGGVDMTVNPRYLDGNQTVEKLNSEVKNKLSDLNSPVFTVSDGEKTYTAVVMPVTKTANEHWKNTEYVEQDGLRYYFSGDRIDHATDDYGNSMKFIYDDTSGRLIRTETSGNDGTQIITSREANGSSLEITSPANNQIRYEYDQFGKPQELIVNDESVAKYKNGNNSYEIDYGGYTERYLTDNNLNIISHQIEKDELPEIIISQNYSYEATGRLATVASLGGINEFRYSEDKLASITASDGGAIEYTYYEDGSLKSIVIASVDSNTKKSQVSGNFDKNGSLMELIDFDGEKSSFAYSSDGRLESAEKSGQKVNYSYDENGRLLEEHLSGGRWMEYKYEEDEGKVNAVEIVIHAQ